MKTMDVRVNDKIVCYDKLNNESAMRVYWTLKTFGAPQVRILNGSFSKWIEEGRKVVQKGSMEEAFNK